MPPDASDTDAPDENIPLQGTHRGNDPDDPLTSSVRAEEPPDPTPRAERVEEDDDAETGAEGRERADEAPGDLGDYQLSHDPASGRHRVALRPPAEEGQSPGGGFRELSRHSSPQEMSDALEGHLSDGPRFMVLENTETGAVRYGQGNELGDNWLAGDYDQATVFEREEEAAAYVEERRENSGQNDAGEQRND